MNDWLSLKNKRSCKPGDELGLIYPGSMPPSLRESFLIGLMQPAWVDNGWHLESSISNGPSRLGGTKIDGLTRHFLIELGFERGPEPIAERPFLATDILTVVDLQASSREISIPVPCMTEAYGLGWANSLQAQTRGPWAAIRLVHSDSKMPINSRYVGTGHAIPHPASPGPALQSVPGIALAATLKERRDEFYGHRNEERGNGMQLFLFFREVPRSLVLFEICSIGPFRLGLRPRPWLKMVTGTTLNLRQIMNPFDRPQVFHVGRKWQPPIKTATCSNCSDGFPNDWYMAIVRQDKSMLVLLLKLHHISITATSVEGGIVVAWWARANSQSQWEVDQREVEAK
ncbi:hypothetical protein BDQ94DRAFT_161493 [Aspergillus welwitschiae]|uniref:Uncharacterized protein n=1 Tax=Aspergillus welwitschiae TaxID=1341132 RepID=A0A3F3PTD9_9EURO|nr:hypothetical protein BDQ94DRAFT_161493 [Aspergillus welwitschiae]RDH30184.1 hypothetical protein BDQ94DRAFT_161493 [Aspergillus welwitschiae]